MFFILGWFAAIGQTSPTSEILFVSSVFTPPNSFTSDVEGPAVDRSGMIYATNFAKQGTIGQVTASGEGRVFIELPNGSIANGIRFDSHGGMVISDYALHNIFKVNMDTRKISVLINEPQMNQPNDIAIDSKDRLYASDPDFKKRTGYIWRIDPDGKSTLLDSLGPANGIEVSPDEKTLYVGEGRNVWAYVLSNEGEVSSKRLLIDFPDFGTDGMRCDIEGNLYVSRIGKGTVVKVSPSGNVLQEIALTGKKPTNVAFGGKDGRTMYVTIMDQGNLESFRTDLPGRAWKMQAK